MDTLLLDDTTEGLKKAAEIINRGGLVAFPTETVYGLGADAFNEEAVSKVYKAKGRPSDNPMIVHLSDGQRLNSLTDCITDDIKILAKHFWPGPLTMIVKANGKVPKITTGGLDTVGVRVPADKAAREFIELANCAIAAPSANLSGKPSPTRADHVKEDLNGKIDAIVVSHDCDLGIESTVVDMTENPPVVLRPGMITPDELAKVLNKPVRLDKFLEVINNVDNFKEEVPAVHGESTSDKDNIRAEEEIRKNGAIEKRVSDMEPLKPKAPGMRYRHYAPEAELIIYIGNNEKIEKVVEEKQKDLILQGNKVEILYFHKMNPDEAANKLFALLRDADRRGADVILATALKGEGKGFSVMNRLLKSAGFNVVNV